MKIDNSVGSVGGLPSSEPRPRPAKNSNASAASGAESTVELSSLAGRMQEIEAALANVPVIDSGRVAEIKQAITEGRFQVDAGKVADGLIDSVRQMLDARARKA
jgi:negative regulator of flagellin synthesis FlgM